MPKDFEVNLASDPIDPHLGVFRYSTFTLEDAFVLEETTGLTINEMVNGIDERKAKALRAIVWFMKFKRGDGDHISTINFNVFDATFEVVPDPTVASSAPDETDTSESSHTSAT